MVRLPKVCEAHSDVRSTSLLGGLGARPPGKFLKFDIQRWDSEYKFTLKYAALHTYILQ